MMCHCQEGQTGIFFTIKKKQKIGANDHETRRKPIAVPVRKFPYLQPFLSQFTVEVRGAAENCKKKTNETPYFWSSRSFKVIDVDTTKKFITGACCDRQHIHAYLQPFSR